MLACAFLLAARMSCGEMVTVRVHYQNGYVLERQKDRDTTSWGISPGGINSVITMVEGLDRLKKLKTIELVNVEFESLSFLLDCPMAEELWISCCTIPDFSVIGNLENLKQLNLDFYINYDQKELIKDRPVNFGMLKKLEKIDFRAKVRRNGKHEGYGCIPYFENVSAGCRFIMESQNIESFSDRDVRILNQFSSVDLYFNPVLDKPEEMRKLTVRVE